MKIDAEDLINYHFPRWNELPEIELYIDQVVSILQKNLSIFSNKSDLPIITASMINNYVKQDIIKPPLKKKYNREHLSSLFVICILKRLMSISEIGDSINSILKIYSSEDAYNLFCNELETAIKSTFNSETIQISAINKTETREEAILKAIVSAFANCILVDRLILLRKK